MPFVTATEPHISLAGTNYGHIEFGSTRNRNIGRTLTNHTTYVLDLKFLKNPSNGRALAHERARITATKVSQSQQHIKTSDWW